MSRLQLALTVSDVDEAVAYYEKVFDTPPAKRRPGYANFAIADPPLKLVLIEGEGGGTLNHLGVESLSVDEQVAHAGRIEGSGLLDRTSESVDCCYAIQDKAWTADPDGLPWEFYRVLEDSPADRDDPFVSVPAASACNSLPVAEGVGCC